MPGCSASTPAIAGDKVFLSTIGAEKQDCQAMCFDRTDGKLAHLDGLNISRAWMLEGIASGLPESDPRRAALHAAADAHSTSGLASVTGEPK